MTTRVIPTRDTKKFTITNSSDLMGTIEYVKNMNFDEEGYMKQSSRAVNVVDERDDSDMGIPLSLGRNFLFDFYTYVVTADKPFIAQTSQALGFSGVEDTDTNHPPLSFKSMGLYWRNLWHVTAQSGGNDTKLYYKNPSTGVWTDTGITLTTGLIHALAIARNKSLAVGQLLVSNGNTVIRLDGSYATIITLTIPTDYEIIKMVFNDENVGIVARLSANARGQNGEAYFFTWDGATTNFNGGWPVGSDGVVCVIPYKSSFVILNTAGKLRYFNGGGWVDLGQLPFYHTGLFWGNSYSQEALGDCMTVDGDLIHININNRLNQFGPKYEQYKQRMPGGIWTYDPKVGIYHRYSPSLSKGYFLVVPPGNVDATRNELTIQSGTIQETGNPIKYVSATATPIGGLKPGTVYYIVKVTSSVFKLALTREDALNGQTIDFTSTGPGTNNNFLCLNFVDYGTTRLDRTGAVGLMGQLNYCFDYLMFGGEYPQYDNSSNSYGTLCVTVGEFPNISYAVVSKLVSENIEDTNQKLFLKYRKLKTGDKIIAKYKDSDYIGLPTTTPQVGLGCDWVDDTHFTTAADLSEAKAYFDQGPEYELECEIYGKAGAGQMSQIADIEYSGGLYTVTLEDSILGAVNGRVCDIIIDNWKLLKTTDNEAEINSSNQKGWAEFPVTTTSKWIKYKVIAEGVEVSFEEILPVSATTISAI